MSSTINGSILNGQGRPWVVFLHSHQFSLHVVLPLRRVPASTPGLTTQSHQCHTFPNPIQANKGLHWALSQNQTAKGDLPKFRHYSAFSWLWFDTWCNPIPFQSLIRLFIFFKASSLQAKNLPPRRDCLQVLFWARAQTNENPSEKVNVEILLRE